MQFEVAHVFDAAIDEVEAAMFHPGYAHFLLARSDLLTSHTVQLHEDDGTQIRRRVRLAPRPLFDHIGTKKVPPEWFEFIEQSTWDRGGRKLSFENVPVTQKVARRLVNRGELLLEALAPGRTKRIARCEVSLRDLPLMARPLAPFIEQVLTREAKRMLETEASMLAAFLREQGARPWRALA